MKTKKEVVIKPSDIKIIDGRVVISDTAYKEIKRLCDIVFYNHFAGVEGYKNKKDMYAEAMLKIIEVIKLDKVDRKVGNLKNYFYTCIRNAMGNYKKKINREIPMTDSVKGSKYKHTTIEYISERIYEENIDTELTIYKEDLKVIKKWDYKSILKVISTLKYMGYEVDVDIDIEGKYYKEVEQLVAIVIWSNRKR